MLGAWDPDLIFFLVVAVIIILGRAFKAVTEAAQKTSGGKGRLYRPGSQTESPSRAAPARPPAGRPAPSPSKRQAPPERLFLEEAPAMQRVGALEERHSVDDRVREDIEGHVGEHLRPRGVGIQPAIEPAKPVSSRPRSRREVANREAAVPHAVAVPRQASFADLGKGLSHAQRAVLYRELLGPPVSLERLRGLARRGRPLE